MNALNLSKESTDSAESPRSGGGATLGRWPLERALFAVAGTVTLLTAVLAVLVSPWFLLMTGFVGVSQWLYVLFGACPASLVLVRLFGLRSTVYPKVADGTPAENPGAATGR